MLKAIDQVVERGEATTSAPQEVLEGIEHAVSLLLDVHKAADASKMLSKVVEKASCKDVQLLGTLARIFAEAGLKKEPLLTRLQAMVHDYQNGVVVMDDKLWDSLRAVSMALPQEVHTLLRDHLRTLRAGRMRSVPHVTTILYPLCSKLQMDGFTESLKVLKEMAATVTPKHPHPRSTGGDSGDQWSSHGSPPPATSTCMSTCA